MVDDLLAMVEQMRVDAEEHARTCTETACRRCDRRPCESCGERTSFESRACNACMAKRQRLERIERWHRIVPKAHHRAHLGAEWLAELVPAPVLSALPSHPGRVTFTGPPGTGKTSLAVALLRREFGAGVANWPSARTCLPIAGEFRPAG